MRAPYDTTCDLVYGPSGAVPGTVYSTRSCRLVFDSHELIQSLPFSERVAYITMDGPAANSYRFTDHGGGDYDLDFSFADLVAVPSGGVPGYQVLFVEEVVYKSHPVYYRVHVQNVAPHGVATFHADGIWIPPPGVVSVSVQAWGCGGSRANPFSSNLSGSGGGAYASDVVAVTPGLLYTVKVPPSGSNGGTSHLVAEFLDPALVALVRADSGLDPDYGGGLHGGQASLCIGSVKFDGGHGGAWYSLPPGPFGGGGGGCAGPLGVGGNGGDGTSAGLGLGGHNGNGGGDGGNGSPAGGDGLPGVAPGGGSGSSTVNPIDGASGQIVLTW